MLRPAVRRSTWVVFTAAILGIASRIWVTEDAAISFRIVENFYNGLGAVYNPGERVETFTHPLWFFLLVLVRGAGIPLYTGSIMLGFFLSACAFGFLIFRHSNRFPFAAAALALHSGVRDFSTSGLEFSVVFLLLVLLYHDLEIFGITAHPGRTAGILALLYLARPELGLLTAWYSLFFVLEATGLFRKQADAPGKVQSLIKSLWTALPSLIRWAVPILLLAGGYHLLRFAYYGDLFANTYYAKSGLDTYYIQGLKYLAYTFLWSPSLWPLLLLLGLAFASTQLRRSIPRTDWMIMVRDFGAAGLLTFYVIRVGGDFMAFRFLLPEIVIFAIVSERIIRNLSFSGAFVKHSITSSFFSTPVHRAATLSGAMALGCLIFLWHPPASGGWVADERNIFAGSTPIYKLVMGTDYSWGVRGKRYRELSSCLGQDLLITNSQAQ
ncbi:MAG: hypothetical protein HY042_08940, partial [Spirochaetia bacterium]|nr:hypothetical protein [Spirochaetia bacterium]